jgi:AmiR/NasT family two-component response regulator
MISKSLAPLGELAVREAGADGYALFRCAPEGIFEHLSGAGVAITPELLGGGSGIRVACYPLHSSGLQTGLLAFAFVNRMLTQAAQARLCRMAAAIGQVWQLSEAVETLAAVAAETGRLEAELADSKIASRTLGFLEEPPEAGDVVDAVTRHVQTVLSRFESNKILEKRRQDLEDELAERGLAARAKAVLRETSGLSEAAAHLHLRTLSRATRRPIREVALELIAHAGEADRTPAKNG